ncbi:MAG: WG repeat-containing protein, partial [Bacteroidia bacterium]
AWQLLFHLKVKEHNFKEIEAFLKEHPKFPFKNNLLRELELIHLTLIPYAKDDSFGFIDTTGKYVISPVYDDVKAFHEELAVVNVNDSLFYIDKDNVRYINQTFSEAYSFYKGIAGVKKENKWFLIDRLGNKHSDFFDDMNELSEEKYIVKNNNLFGCINQHGDYIIPCELEKMGDFKNSAAYYTKDGKYGFIHIQNNYTAPALFDWLSNFDEKGIAVFKMNNRFGLINSKGQKLCDANYDQLLRISDSLYLAVVNNKYGFISHSGCEILAVEYDYNPLIPITEYEGNGYLLCIIDEKKFFKSHDGLSFFQKHKFDDIYVPAEQLVLVQKKNKYGFVNLNGDKVIPTQYLSAEKFIKGTAIVETEEGFTLIDRLGNKLIPETAEIKRFNENLLFISGEKDELIDKTGKILQNNIKSYEVYKPYLLLELEKGEIKVIRFE